MNIPESGGQRPIVPGEVTPVDKTSHAKSKAQQRSVPAGQSPAVGHEPDSKLADLLNRLEQSDQVRSDVVASAEQQVRSGELLNRETAEKTAASVLGIVKHF